MYLISTYIHDSILLTLLLTLCSNKTQPVESSCEPGPLRHSRPFSHEGQEETRPQAFQQMEITFPDCPCWRYNYHNSPGCQWKCSTGP